LAYLIEEHEDGSSTVMLPSSPTPFSGVVRIVPRHQVELLNVSLGDLSTVLSQWGVGARDLIARARQ
jgi:uncharacterized membrane protein